MKVKVATQLGRQLPILSYLYRELKNSMRASLIVAVKLPAPRARRNNHSQNV
jgi:hypothetical protein